MLSKHQLLFDQHAERACIGLAHCAEAVCLQVVSTSFKSLHDMCRRAAVLRGQQLLWAPPAISGWASVQPWCTFVGHAAVVGHTVPLETITTAQLLMG